MGINHLLKSGKNLEIGESITPSLIEYWSQFNVTTLARLLLSFVPMLKMLREAGVEYHTIGSFGSGSCSHEAALALQFSHATVFCHDITSKYIPEKTKSLFDSCDRLRFYEVDCSQYEVEQQFDLTFSIQTLEHIQDYFSALCLMANSVNPSGYLYIDTPYFHEKPELEPEIEYHRKRVWQNNQHYHLGFSRSAMIERIESLGYQIISSGYYSYTEFDLAALEGIRRPLTGKTILSTKESIRETIDLFETSLDLAENFYQDMFDRLDTLTLQKRKCNAIRILAQKNESSKFDRT